MNGLNPKIAIVLGSGLGVLSEEIKDKIVIKYNEIPNFPVSTVAGHAGELIVGKIGEKEVIAMNGRFHFYEGYDLKEATFPIRVFKLLGIETLILTNAAGGITEEYEPGDFMVINDYLSFFAESVLRGQNLDEFGERFIDVSETFNKELSQKLKKIIDKYTGRVQEGVYAYMKGPTYETPAEIRAFQTLGADAVGMSTVPEVIVAAHSGLKVLGISAITNHAAGFQSSLNHEEVVAVTQQIKEDFKTLVKSILAELN